GRRDSMGFGELCCRSARRDRCVGGDRGQGAGNTFKVRSAQLEWAPLVAVIVGQSICLRCLDARARCCGSGPTIGELPGRYLQLDADSDLCGITLDGGMRCWPLVDGAPSIEAPGDFVQLAVGPYFTCPIDRAGMHHCNEPWFRRARQVSPRL
ncbi:MAG: hypothetical protein ACI9U2_003492, partial [Bradymonadia bacterium]